MSGVRVLRLIEYYYPSQEEADLDMSRWNAPAIGARSIAFGVLRSTIIQQPFDFPEGHILNQCLMNECPEHAHLFAKPVRLGEVKREAEKAPLTPPGIQG